MTDARAALDHLVEAMLDAADAEVLPRFRTSSFTIRQKSDADDLVTEADEQAERRMTSRLAALYPNALIVGEEAATANPALPKGLPHADLAFILDPVDGTINFAAGVPLFAMIGAVAMKGRVVAGAILDPIRRDLMLAVAGRGAWRRTADGAESPLKVRTPAPLMQSSGIGFWLDIAPERRAAILARAALLPSITVLRCSGHEYRLMASGGCDFILYATPGLKSWDHAAGLLICREAGAYAATLDGEEWPGLAPATSTLIASSKASWSALRDFLTPDWPA